jgi:hypothetical protein
MCKDCQVAYSFFFGVQYHKPNCPVIVGQSAEQVLATTAKEIANANPMTRADFLASDHGK